MKNITCLSILAILLAGCTTPSTQSEQPVADSTILLPQTSELDSSSSFFSSTKILSDRKIRLRGNDVTGITSIDIKDPNDFDIRDLSAFTITLYRSILQRKLRAGETLSDLDLALLKFIWKTQNEALKAFTLKGYTSIMGDPISPGRPSDLQPDVKTNIMSLSKTITDDCLNIAVSNFFTNNNPLVVRVDSWAQGFHSLNRNTRKADIDRILAANNRLINNVQWRQYFAAGAVLVSFGLSGGLLTHQVETHTGPFGFGENKKLREYKKYVIPKQFASAQWNTLFKSLSYYVSDCSALYDDTSAYLSKTIDSHSKRQIEDYRMLMSDDITETMSKFRAVYCDYPFATACCKTYISVQSRKGIFNDDEEAMKQDASDLTSYVSGTDMLKLLSSPYSASVYVDLLALLKSELGNTEWQSFVTTHKLYEHNSITFADSLFKENTLNKSN